MVEVIRDLPYRVRVVPHCYIPLSDGTRLAARLWLPEDVEMQPVAAILEYLPYRKGDGTAIDDATRHGYFAGHGFASVRVDIRGSGDSDGVLADEYSAAELADACEVIAWLAVQPWCNGRVGMLGISWGGFNALQVAALAPPALRAVISVCSTDDRYADDVHYVGGAVLARDMLGWAMTLLALNARPPDPATVGEDWRALWQQRLDETPPFIDAWLAHPTRDAYWRHGSVCEDYAAIRVPVLMVGGWADGYTNAVPRILQNLTAPVRAIVGPWAHHWPNAGAPGPDIDFLGEAIRWWQQWLNGTERGVLEVPPLRVWLQRHTAPQPKLWPGRWVGTDLEPESIDVRELHLDVASHGLLEAAAEGADTSLPWDAAHGSAAGAWCPFSPADLARDQREDDARCLCFDSAPLAEALILLGRPAMLVDVAKGPKDAQVVARLCEVAPDGSSLLLSWGVVVLTGDAAQVKLELNCVGHELCAGHRLRLALGSSYWPMLWPPYHRETAVLRAAGCRLRLPVWRGDGVAVAFEPARCAPPPAYDVLRKASVTHPSATVRRVDQGRVRHANGMTVDSVGCDDVRWSGAQARVICSRSIEMARDAWSSRIEVTGEMADTADGFAVSVQMDATLGGAPVTQRRWQFRFPRR
jgi:putative CocE/NonD family hydrolase